MKNNCICQDIRLSLAVLTDFAMEKLRNFSVFDVAIFKLCLFSIGALFGTFFSEKLKKIVPLMAIIAIVTYVYLMYKCFVEGE